MNRGKAEADGTGRANRSHRSCRGIGDGMQAEGTRGNTGSPSGGRASRPTGNSRETGRAVLGWRRGPYDR